MRSLVSNLRLLCLVGLLGATPADAYQDLQLRLRSPAARPLQSDLPLEERLRRIELLEADWNQLSDREIHRRNDAIAQLYATSELSKHRVWAIQLIEEGLQAGHRPPLDVLHTRAAIREGFFNHRAAFREFEDAARAYPERAAAHRELARARFDQGLHTMDAELLLGARRGFETARTCADTDSDDLIGLASVLVALDDIRALRDVVAELRARDDRPLGTALFAGLASSHSGHVDDAERWFLEAIPRLDPALRNWFERGHAFFADRETPVALTAPLLASRAAPPGLVQWWARLVETEILFAQPRLGRHGWDSVGGQLFLRYGRPDVWVFRSQLSVNSRVRHPDGDWMVDVGSGLDGPWFAGTDVWIWVYDLDGVRYPVVFPRGSEMAPWSADTATLAMVRQLARAAPFRLRPAGEAGGMRFAVRHAAFRGSGGRIRVESSLALARANPGERDAGFKVSLVIQDDAGEVVDRVEDLTGESRTSLLDRVGLRPGESDVVLHQIGASLAPGRYVVTLEAEDPVTGEVRAHQREVDLKAPAPGLEMSDLQLCDAFGPADPRMELPASFVKHAHAVVPHPEAELWAGQEQASVYYEVYDAALDAAGQAELDVIYELFRRADFHPWEAGLPAGQGGVPPVWRAEFVRERTGRSPEGVVVKGTRIAVGELPPGDYVLVVTLSDRIARREVQRFVEFRKPGTRVATP